MARLLRWTRTLAAAIGCWWLLVTFTPLERWWADHLANPWGPGTGDVLVVLSGDSMSDGILGASSYLRAVYAIRAIRANHFRKVIISGGTNTGEKPVPAELIRDFLTGHGIDVRDVIVEPDSISTEENARRVALLLRGESGRIVLLTSDYHVWRASRVFRKQGLAVEPWPVPDVLKRFGAWQNRGGLFFELCQESLKIVWYRWKGWI